jgi:hypothetical protein
MRTIGLLKLLWISILEKSVLFQLENWVFNLIQALPAPAECLRIPAFFTIPSLLIKFLYKEIFEFFSYIFSFLLVYNLSSFPSFLLNLSLKFWSKLLYSNSEKYSCLGRPGRRLPFPSLLLKFVDAHFLLIHWALSSLTINWRGPYYGQDQSLSSQSTKVNPCQRY